MNNNNNNNNNNSIHPLTIPTNYESNSSDESLHVFESPHSNPYANYPSTSKFETIDYHYWPTTHQMPSNSSHEHMPTMETLGPVSSVNLTNQHIQQNHYPSPPSTWIKSNDYQPLHSTISPTSYSHYPTSYPFYPPNNFYDSSQVQWMQPTATYPIKFESPYNSPPSYLEQSEYPNQCQEKLNNQQFFEPSQQLTLDKPQTSTTKLSSIPPRNPFNGKTRTRDKYRIVYTDQQRYELENEFVVSQYISIPRKAALSVTLALSERQIKIWFQNRRAKERKLNKKRQEVSTKRQLNHSNDVDSPSDDDFENPKYCQNYK